MKTLYKTLWLAALPLAFAACQNEEIETGQATGTPGNHTLHCTIGNDMQSRAQVQLNNTDIEKEFFMWNSEDSFAVYDHADYPETGIIKDSLSRVFTITGYNDETPSASANFIGEELPNGHQVTALYPISTLSSSTVNNGSILLNPDFGLGNAGANTPEDQKAYLARNMYMYANTTINGEQTNLTFQHLCALARISYTNATDTDQNIAEVRLCGNASYFSTTTVFFNIHSLQATSGYAYNHAGLKFKDFTVPSGQTADFYILFFPSIFPFTADGNLTVKIKDTDQKEYVTDILPTADISATNNGATQFEAGKRYWFNVMQTEEGLEWRKKMPEVLITNTALVQAIESDRNIQFKKNAEGFVDVNENYTLIQGITFLYLVSQDLTSLEGIEHFKNLKELIVYSNSLSQLDISQNLKLEKLSCGSNQLQTLDITNNTLLKELDCWRNQLEKIDISQNILLEKLIVESNKLTQLDVSNHPNLTILNASYNQLTELNLSKNSNLQMLSCSNNKLSGTLDLSHIHSLEICNCDRNEEISQLLIAQDAPLRNIDFTYNKISYFDFGTFDKLEKISCSNNPLSSINVSKNTKLTVLEIGGESFTQTELDFSNNTLLVDLYCRKSKKLQSIKVSQCSNLESLNCSNCSSLTTLDISNNKLLSYLCFSDCNLTEINIENNLALEQLLCENNQLTSLNLTKNNAIRILNCNDNHLKALDIRNLNLPAWKGPGYMVPLLCGKQKDANGDLITTTLTLTSNQKVLWEGETGWSGDTYGRNQNVTLNVSE